MLPHLRGSPPWFWGRISCWFKVHVFDEAVWPPSLRDSLIPSPSPRLTRVCCTPGFVNGFWPSYLSLLFSSLFVLLLLRPSPNSYSHWSHVASSDGCWVGLISGMIRIPRGYDSLQVSHVPGWSAVKWGGTLISLSPSEATQTPFVVLVFCILISIYQLITPVFWI